MKDLSNVFAVGVVAIITDSIWRRTWLSNIVAGMPSG